jgi:hypothetical protein
MTRDQNKTKKWDWVYKKLGIWMDDGFLFSSYSASSSSSLVALQSSLLATAGVVFLQQILMPM